MSPRTNYIQTPAQYPDELPVVMFDPPEQPMPSANLAARANDRIRRLEAGHAHLLTLSDAPGNGVDKFLDWFTALPLWQQVCYLFGAVLALGLSAVLLVGPK